jgi:hypothetical protein
MLTGLFYAHSGWRYIILVVLALTLVKALIGLLSRGRWSGLDNWLNRLSPIVLDIQFLLGLVLWILQQRWMGGNTLASWEHPVTMLIATALAHVTSTRIKRAPTDAAKFQTATVGYLVAALVVALGVARITRVM